MSVAQHSYDKVDFKYYPVSVTKTTKIVKGDHVWYDKTAAVAKSAVDFPWQGSLAQTLRQFAAVYIGISLDESPAGTNTPPGTFLTQDKIRVAKRGAGRHTCASQTLTKASLITLVQNGVTSALKANEVTATTDVNAAIGKCLHDGTVQTEALYEIFPRGDDLLSGTMFPYFVADPGTGVAIPVNKGMYQIVEFDIAAAEVNTLPAASWVGQEILLTVKTRTGGGARVVTVFAAFNDAGNTILTFNAVGETAVLKAGADLAYNILVTKGAAAS